VRLSLTQSAQVTITGEALGAAPFPDTAGHWAEPSVNAIFARGVLGGVSLTAFGPDRPMTRAMAVTALWRLAGEPAAPADGDFSDLTGLPGVPRRPAGPGRRAWPTATGTAASARMRPSPGRSWRPCSAGTPARRPPGENSPLRMPARPPPGRCRP
jgi:hypothetical protein